MPRHGVLVVATAFTAALALAAGPALAEPGVSVSQESTGLVFTVDYDQAIVHFVYTEQGCPSNQPCYVVTVGVGLAPVPVLLPGPCQVNQATNSLECPAAGLSTLDFKFKQSGSWSGYNGGGYHASPCAPAGVTVESGPGKVVEINTYDGCAETVVCQGAPGSLVIVEADVSDEVRGPCMSIQRH